MLQYTDNTILFVEDDREFADNLKAMVLWLSAVLGLILNIRKTKVFLVNNPQYLQQVHGLWNCQIASLPDLYLGAPLGANYKNKEV